jgi:hypothetical protein
MSKSKKGKGNISYLSLLLVIDKPENDQMGTINDFLAKLNEDNFKQHLNETDTIVSMPEMTVGPSIIIKHIDIIMNDFYVENKTFIANTLYPSFGKITNCATSPLVWWNEDPDKIGAFDKTGHFQNEKASSLFQKIQNLFARNTR